LSLYLASSALVSNSPDQIADWKTHFSDRSQWIFSAFAATIFFGILRSYYILEVIPQWWSFLALAVYTAAALIKRREFHVAATLLSILFLGLLLSRDFSAA
jgi:hypothetical protein